MLVTDVKLKAASVALLEELLRHSSDPADMFVILGTVISGIARGTTDPVGSAEAMIDGLRGWIEMYRSGRMAS